MRGITALRPRAAANPPGTPTAWWVALVPLAALLLSLVGLLATALLCDRSVRGEWRAIAELSIPAREVIDHLERDVVGEIGARRGYLLTGRTSYVARLRAQQAMERQDLARLAALADALDPGVARAVAELRPALARWHALPLERAGDPPTAAPLADEDALVQPVLARLAALRTATAATARERRERIERIESLQLALSLSFLLVAVAATVFVFRLGGRLRDLAMDARRAADEAEARGRELERALAETARISDEKARLVRGVTHDLKNPLGAVVAYCELLQMGGCGPLTSAQDHTISRIRAAAGTMLLSINELLDLAEAEAGALRIERRATDIAEVVREAVADYHVIADVSGLRLVVDLPPALPSAATDRRRVREILDNLLSNAFKYTPHGGSVTLRASVVAERRGAAGPWLGIAVADTGQGIAPDAQERIFEEFYRASDDHRGSGLGLAISRRIARLLGGDLTVESECGRGSTFTLWLPLSAQAAERASVR
ncbi:MAG: HAMP domain-containing histidine kinase [Gemmatimonadetes bacterium]|nr:HAMP domain-containing histidine kinase [Gemmatimonadota bacterium]